MTYRPPPSEAPVAILFAIGIAILLYGAVMTLRDLQAGLSGI